MVDYDKQKKELPISRDGFFLMLGIVLGAVLLRLVDINLYVQEQIGLEPKVSIFDHSPILSAFSLFFTLLFCLGVASAFTKVYAYFQNLFDSWVM